MKDTTGVQKVLIGIAAAGAGVALFYGITQLRAKKTACCQNKKDCKSESCCKESGEIAKEKDGEISKEKDEEQTVETKKTDSAKDSEEPPHPEAEPSVNLKPQNGASEDLSVSSSFEKLSLSSMSQSDNKNSDTDTPPKSPSDSFERVSLSQLQKEEEKPEASDAPSKPNPTPPQDPDIVNKYSSKPVEAVPKEPEPKTKPESPKVAPKPSLSSIEKTRAVFQIKSEPPQTNIPARSQLPKPVATATSAKPLAEVPKSSTPVKPVPVASATSAKPSVEVPVKAVPVNDEKEDSEEESESEEEESDEEEVDSEVEVTKKDTDDEEDTVVSYRSPVFVPHPQDSDCFIELGIIIASYPVIESDEFFHVIEEITEGSFGQEIGFQLDQEVVQLNMMSVSRWSHAVLLELFTAVTVGKFELVVSSEEERVGDDDLPETMEVTRQVTVNLYCQLEDAARDVSVQSMVVEREQHVRLAPYDIRLRAHTPVHRTTCWLQHNDNYVATRQRALYLAPLSADDTPDEFVCQESEDILTLKVADTDQYVAVVDRTTLSLIGSSERPLLSKADQQLDPRHFFVRHTPEGATCLESTQLRDHYVACEGPRLSLRFVAIPNSLPQMSACHLTLHTSPSTPLLQP